MSHYRQAALVQGLLWLFLAWFSLTSAPIAPWQAAAAVGCVGVGTFSVIHWLRRDRREQAARKTPES